MSELQRFLFAAVFRLEFGQAVGGRRGDEERKVVRRLLRVELWFRCACPFLAGALQCQQLDYHKVLAIARQ